MDKQRRLTRWDEWRVGETYRWMKGGRTGEAVRCVEVNSRERFVRIARDAAMGGEKCVNWRGRFVHVPRETLAQTAVTDA